MNAWLIGFSLLACLGGQVESAGSPPNESEAIAKAVQDLGAPVFAVRRRATRFLWEQGLDAQDALERVADSDDREVRMRAGHILRDFRYGILPGVPPEVVAQIRLFRDGDLQQRMQSMAWLADHQQFDAVQRLIQLEPNPDARLQYLVALLQNEQAVEYFLDRERLESLIAAIGADQNATWRKTALARALCTPAMIQKLLDRGQLDQLVQLIDQEPSADMRSGMLSILFSNSAAIAVLIEKDQLDLVLDLIAKEPQPRNRSQWISGLLLNSKAINTLAEDERLERVLAFAKDHMDDDERTQTVMRMFHSSTVLKAILDQRGIDRLLAMAAMEKKPEARGQLMAAMVSSSTVRAKLQQNGQLDLAMKLAREEKDITARAYYLKAIMQSSVVYYLLRDTERRKEMWELVKSDLDQAQEDDTDWRGEVLYRIFTSYPSAEELLKKKAESEWLLKYLKEYASKSSRSRILERVASDFRLKGAMLKHIGLEPMLELVQQVGTPQRGRIMGRLFASSSSSQPVLKADKLELLITLARKETDMDSRSEYLQGLFQSSTTMKLLVDGGYYDKLWELIESEEDAVRHASLRGYFARNASVLEILKQRKQLDSLVDFARESEDDDARQTYLRLLFSSQTAMDALIEKGHFDTLLEMAKSEQEEASRMMLLTEFYVNGKVIERLAELKQASVLLEFAKQQADENRRRNFLQRVLYNTGAVSALVDEGQVDELLALIRSQENKYSRSSLLRALFNGPAVARYYADNKKLKELFQILTEEEDESTRQQVLSSLLGRSDTIAVIVQNGGLDDLVAAVQQHIKPDVQGQLLGQMVVQSQVVEYLKQQQQVDRILKLATTQPSINSRRSFLQTLFGSTTAVAALIGNGQFEKLYELASSDGDPRLRAQYRARLLSNSATVQHLVQGGNIQLLLKVAREQSDERTRRTIVSQILSSKAAVEALVEHGQFTPLLDLCKSIGDETSRRRMYAELLLSPRAVESLAKTGDLEQVVQDVLKESDENVLRSFFERWLSNLEAIAASLEQGQFTVLYKAAVETVPEDRKKYFLRRLTYDDAAGDLLARPEIGRALLEWLEATSDSEASTYARQVTQNARLTQAMIRSGQADRLLKIVALDSDAAYRQRSLERILYRPSGLVAHHVIEGDVSKALELLEEHATSDLGRVRLAAFLLTTGQLDERIQDEQARLAQSADGGDLRLLLYLLRAKGDLDGAREAAGKCQDPGLLKAVLVEQRRWDQAAQLLTDDPCPLPVPLTSPSGETETHRRVERLGFLAAYHRLAGHEADCDAALKEVRELAAAEPGDKKLQWYAIEALLLNDRYGAGLELITQFYPLRAFDLYVYQHRYDLALDIVHWPADAAADRAWLDSLPPGDLEGELEGVGRSNAALKTARLLNLLGQQDQALQVIELVKAYAEEQPLNNSSSAPRRQCWGLLCRTLLAVGEEEAAWQFAAKTMLSPQSTPYVLQQIYSRSSNSEALGWWTVLSKRHPGEPPESIFARIHALMNPRGNENVEQFETLVEESAKSVPSLSSTYRSRVLGTLAAACQRRQRPELVVRCFELAGSAAGKPPIQLADALRQLDRWQDAAAVYRQVWEQDRQQLVALALAGYCLEQAGQVEQGQGLQNLANQIAIDSRARFDMARALRDRGLNELADRQFRLVLRTAPFEYWEWNDASRLLADRAAAEAPAEAAVLLEYSQLDDLRTTFYLLDRTDYVNVRSIIYRWQAQAAIAAGDFERFEACVDRAISASPASSAIAEELVPALDRAGQKERADKLFRRIYGPYHQSVEDYPKSAFLNNNCAWLAARCGRELDEAFRLAQLAVKLQPENGSYADTLAEVYFRRGDRESAIKYSRRACQLDPESESLRKQLRKFENDPLPSS